jgi:hypothetical protein
MTNSLNYAPTQNTSKNNAIILALGANLTLEMFFHIIQSEQITLSTDITDHIVEDHTSVQDHITIKPRTFTMKGLISEKVFIQPDTIYIKRPSELWRNKLVKLGFLIPPLSSDVSSAINAVEAVANKIYGMGLKVYNAITGAIMTIRQMQGSPFASTIQVNQSHQRWSADRIQKAVIDILDYYRTNRIPISINTGWDKTLDNYYITDISVNQGDTYQQSELSVTVKQLRFTDIKTVKLTAEEISRYNQDVQEVEKINAGRESWLYNKTIKGYRGYE